MLEKVSFNYKLYRYRRENATQGIAYNLRYGNIIFLKGKSNNLVEKVYLNGQIEVNTENEAIIYLKNLGVIVSEEDCYGN